MIDPNERLGAGEPGTPNDMDALRRHPFFESIDWETLWSDPAPPMEAGLVKKVHPLSENGIDAGFQWDQFVGSSNSSESNSPWEEDSEHDENLMANGYPFAGAGGEVGPLTLCRLLQTSLVPLALSMKPNRGDVSDCPSPCQRPRRTLTHPI